ncbi:methyltransferase domain containing protein [Nitzschia inconspicua]|uniref:Methyltransferase domain containing protein n=1 Tax=Nitzschia inconspicua TaxID=303405 RepID=A0A9K3LWH8_9STRA|nr:methyltransferase domain containing protein [Nitzschia inconspicua]
MTLLITVVVAVAVVCVGDSLGLQQPLVKHTTTTSSSSSSPLNQKRIQSHSQWNWNDGNLEPSYNRRLFLTIPAPAAAAAAVFGTIANPSIAMEVSDADPSIGSFPEFMTPTQYQQQQQQQQQQQEDDYEKEQKTERPFKSAAYSKKEYTNSIVASRDTNISPLEVYDTLKSRLIPQQQLQQQPYQQLHGNADPTMTSLRPPRRALDVGAGAGVSTQVIYEMGYTEIDAVDWSGDAWQKNVVEEGYCPSSVHFYQMDDERFVQKYFSKIKNRYDVIAFNFAVNPDKAVHFATTMLNDNGVLLAPVNVNQDYWLKQTYQLMDATGRIIWSANDVGAWSVQFQPDVTQDTCQGVWCAPFNGFQKMRQQY